MRKRQGLSQLTLAKNIGVSRTYFSLLENKHYTPSVTLVEKWCQALGCKLNIMIDV
ncbi:MAG: helix-turn-helix transcriptional regulator [Promethearchaeota archaeon]